MLDFDEFNVIVTDESMARRKMYQTEAKRLSLKDSYNGNELQFLKDCKLLLTIENVNRTNFERCFELVQRTNQLNLSGIKYSLDEFNDRIHANKMQTIALHCKDKFGSYGQIGFIAFQHRDNEISVVEYAMSCRVAGKWLEPAILNYLMNKYRTDRICFYGKNNLKNQRLFKTLVDFGMSEEIDGNDIKLEICKSDLKCVQVVSIEDKYNPIK